MLNELVEWIYDEQLLCNQREQSAWPWLSILTDVPSCGHQRTSPLSLDDWALSPRYIVKPYFVICFDAFKEFPDPITKSSKNPFTETTINKQLITCEVMFKTVLSTLGRCDNWLARNSNSPGIFLSDLVWGKSKRIFS